MVVNWVKLSRGVVLNGSAVLTIEFELESCDVPAGVEEAKRRLAVASTDERVRVL